MKYMRDGDKVGRDEYPITTTWDLDFLICTEVLVRRNQQSIYENRGGRGGRQQKGCIGQTFYHKCQGATQGGTKINATLFPG